MNGAGVSGARTYGEWANGAGVCGAGASNAGARPDGNGGVCGVGVSGASVRLDGIGVSGGGDNRGYASRRCRDEGFTVVELLMAFTILAIISGSLFQVFFISSRNNERAADYDTANGLAITAAEIFKANAGLDGSDMFGGNGAGRDGAGGNGANGNGAGRDDAGENSAVRDGAVRDGAADKTWRSADGRRYVKYYDASWRELNIAVPAPGFEADVPDGAAFALEALVSEPAGGGSADSLIPAAVRLSLDSAQDYRLVIDEVADELIVVFNGVRYKVENAGASRAIWIDVEYTQTGVLPKRITVDNRTGLSANVSVFGAPDGGAAAGAYFANAGAGSAVGAAANAEAANAEAPTTGAESASASVAGAPDGGAAATDSDAYREKYVDVTAAAGSVNAAFYKDQPMPATGVFRVLEVSVRALSDGEPVLARVESGKYVG